MLTVLFILGLVMLFMGMYLEARKRKQREQRMRELFRLLREPLPPFPELKK